MFSIEGLERLIHEQSKGEGGELHVEQTVEAKVKEVSNVPSASFPVRRNEIIADLFYRMDKVERAGTGIQRMKDSMVGAGLPLAEIKYDTFFTITLRRPLKEEMPGSVKSSVIILEAITANKNVSAKDISQSLGISLRAVEKQLFKLKESGHLRRVGPARGGYWEIVE